VPQRPVEVEGVLVAPSGPLPVQVAGLFEVGDDGLDRSFGELAGKAMLRSRAFGSRAMASSTLA
jgi:hypothetical protein